MQIEKKELQGLEYCPLCGHKLKRKKKRMTDKAKVACQENGRKGGRPKKEKSEE